VKRGTRIPQSLKEKTKELIMRLEKKGVLRKSRNGAIRLEKPNGAVRLVSNLMSLNDITYVQYSRYEKNGRSNSRIEVHYYRCFERWLLSN
jgi:hypothetical protein